MKLMLPILAAAALVGCATYPGGPVIDSPYPTRTDGMAMLNQPTRVGRLVVTPTALVEDSRCPMNARCVWAGQVIITARIDGHGWRETHNLTLGKPYATHATSVTLTSARPDKMTGVTVPPQAYVFGFEGGY